MLYCAHIFIGFKSDELVKSVMLDIVRQNVDIFQYNKFYTIQGRNDLQVNKLNLNEDSYANFVDDNTLRIDTQEFTIEKEKEFSDLYSKKIYDDILTINNCGQQDSLYVFLHFPIYSGNAMNIITEFSSAVIQSKRITNLNFIGYDKDLPGCDVKNDGTVNVISTIENIRANHQELSKLTTYFILIQNKTQTGFSLEINNDDVFANLIKQLIIILSVGYKEIFYPTIDYKDVIGLGFASLDLNKDAIAKYLFRCALLKSMNNANVNNSKIDINKTINETSDILLNKQNIYTQSLEKEKDEIKIRTYIEKEVNEIDKRLQEQLGNNLDITYKASVFAALLAKTDCELFENQIYNGDSPNLDDLYEEVVNYFIAKDICKYLEINNQPVFNPIEDLKNLNKEIINSEYEIRRLQELTSKYEKLIKDSDKVNTKIIENKTDYHDYKFIENIKEDPLNDVYVLNKDNIKESADLRDSFSSIKDQGKQGSCLSFSLVSVFEYLLRVSKSEECDLSEAFLYYNGRFLDNDSKKGINEDYGLRFKPAIESLIKYGISLEKYCRYNPEQYNVKPSPEAYKDAESKRLVSAMSVTPKSEDIKSAISEGYPVVASFILTKDFYSGKTFISCPSEEESQKIRNKTTETDSTNGCHAMVIVGYSDKLNMFIVRNSWGISWGEAGYCYIPYSFVDEAKLCDYACIIKEIALMKDTEIKIDIPALKIDNTDISIKYYSTLAALKKEKKTLEDNKFIRNAKLKYFVELKTLLSNPNKNDEFVKVTTEELNKQYKEKEVEKEKKESERKREKDKYHKRSRKDIIKYGVVLLVVLVCFYGWNLLWEKYIYEFVEYNLHLRYRWYFLFLGAYSIYKFIKMHLDYKSWRSNDEEYNIHISNKHDELIALRTEIKGTKLHAFAAGCTIRSLENLLNKINDKYNRFIDLINQLRIWYAEVNEKEKNTNLLKFPPDISLFDESKWNTYFNDYLSENEISKINFSKEIGDYKVSDDYFPEFKKRLHKKITDKIDESLKGLHFNISEHILRKTYNKYVTIVDDSKKRLLCCNANPFVYYRLSERGIANKNSLIVYPKLKENGNDSSLIDNSEKITWDNDYKLTYVTMVPLLYSEIQNISC